jgi:hypothetical protein
MRLPGCAPDAIWPDAVPRERHHASGAPQRWRARRPGRKKRRSGRADQIAISSHSSSPSARCVVDDLPDAVQIDAQELEVIETYLGAGLNELLEER